MLVSVTGEKLLLIVWSSLMENCSSSAFNVQTAKDGIVKNLPSSKFVLVLHCIELCYI